MLYPVPRYNTQNYKATEVMSVAAVKRDLHDEILLNSTHRKRGQIGASQSSVANRASLQETEGAVHQI